MAGIDNDGLAGDAARIDQIAQRADHVLGLDPPPQRIVGVHRLEILLALPA